MAAELLESVQKMKSGKTPLRTIAFAVAIGLLGGTGFAQIPPRPENVGWVGLYNGELVDWLENENRLESLCRGLKENSTAARACREEKLKPKEVLLHLRSAPRNSAASEGFLVIRAIPGHGLRAYFRPADSTRELEFVPDLFDVDWGYGPYFHQTFLDRRGTWFLLPAVPLPHSAWAHIAEADVLLVRDFKETGSVIKTPNAELVVLDLQGTELRARHSQAADGWCNPGDPPRLKPWKEMRLPVASLYGPTGHLLVDIKNKRGC